jgi:pyochelin biosynthesis protein PchC
MNPHDVQKTTDGAALAELWFRRFDAAPVSRHRLICLPHAGGAATFFRPLSAALAPSVETICIQYPGRQDRRHERTIDDLRELAARIVDVLRLLDDRPMALFGHSMGATLGFEVARRLEAGHGPLPLALFASGRRAPSRHRPERAHLSGDEALIDDIRTLSGTDARVLQDEELLRLALPALRGDYRAIETYRYPVGIPPLGCPITVLVGDSDPRVSMAEAEAWREHTTNAFDMHVFSGGHFYLPSHWAEIADRIRAILVR